MAARSEAEINSLLVYKSPARQGGVLYFNGRSSECASLIIKTVRHREDHYSVSTGRFQGLEFVKVSGCGEFLLRLPEQAMYRSI